MKKYSITVTSDIQYPNIFAEKQVIVAKNEMEALKIIEKYYGKKEIQEKQLGFEISKGMRL